MGTVDAQGLPTLFAVDAGTIDGNVTASKLVSIPIHNSTDFTLNLSTMASFSFQNAYSDFSFDSTTCTDSVAPGADCALIVSVNPNVNYSGLQTNVITVQNSQPQVVSDIQSVSMEIPEELGTIQISAKVVSTNVSVEASGPGYISYFSGRGFERAQDVYSNRRFFQVRGGRNHVISDLKFSLDSDQYKIHSSSCGDALVSDHPCSVEVVYVGSGTPAFAHLTVNGTSQGAPLSQSLDVRLNTYESRNLRFVPITKDSDFLNEDHSLTFTATFTNGSYSKVLTVTTPPGVLDKDSGMYDFSSQMLSQALFDEATNDKHSEDDNGHYFDEQGFYRFTMGYSSTIYYFALRVGGTFTIETSIDSTQDKTSESVVAPEGYKFIQQDNIG